MTLYEREMVNDKESNISKESIEKSNSLFIKSLEDGVINFVDLLSDKLLLSIKFSKNNDIYQITNKSLFKIFNLFCNDNIGENIESLLSEYITFNILDENDDFMINNQDNSISMLDAPFIKLLEQTKNYIINITSINIEKNIKLNLETKNIKINIKSNSINQICKFLGKTIYEISDYINILILYLNDDDINKATIQSKIIDKYSKTGHNTFFMGKKLYKFDLKIPTKNDKNTLFRFDDLFENILNKIDNIENNSSEDNQEENNINKNINNNIDIDFEFEAHKKYIEQKIKINRVNYDENDENDDKNEINDNMKTKCNCQKDICSLCNIF